MLFDNIADPYQLNNLVNKPESQKLQSKLEKSLTKKLKEIGDEDFKYAQYYLDKWGYDFTKSKSAPYNVTPGKMMKVYTPRKQ